jgi:hypothetical protein
MADDQLETPGVELLLADLVALNRSLRRMRVEPLVEIDAAYLLSPENLRHVVDATSDQVGLVARNLRGML